MESSQLVGIDIEERFMELGYDLFLDRSKFAGQFFAVDLLNVADEEKLKEIKESLDIIYISSFLHLFPYGSQYSACVKLSSLLKSKGLILGRQIGSRRNPGEKEKKSRPGENSYFHDEESFTRMWEDVGREVGIKWSVRAWFDVGRYSWGVKMGEKKEGKGKEEEEEEEGEQWKGDKEWLYFEVTRL